MWTLLSSSVMSLIYPIPWTKGPQGKLVDNCVFSNLQLSPIGSFPVKNLSLQACKFSLPFPLGISYHVLWLKQSHPDMPTGSKHCIIGL